MLRSPPEAMSTTKTLAVGRNSHALAVREQNTTDWLARQRLSPAARKKVSAGLPVMVSQRLILYCLPQGGPSTAATGAPSGERARVNEPVAKLTGTH